MSANNWANCPKCNSTKQYEALKLKLKNAYGKVSRTEYLALVDEAEKVKLKTLNCNESVREDYEIGILRDGTFSIDYHAQCTADRCGFTYSFKHKEKL